MTTAASAPSSTCSPSPTRSARAWRSSIPKGGLDPQRDGGLLARRATTQAGYEFVNSPHITKAELFETSGHLEWFAEGMFPPMELDDGQRYYLKPMNCPFHILIYRSRQRSYRELPTAPVRVRQRLPLREVRRRARSHPCAGDDPGRRAHLLHAASRWRRARTRCSPSCSICCGTSGSTTSTSSCRPNPRRRRSASDEEWEEATEALRRAALAMDLELVLDEGGGAFYGPKISVQARDAIGRTWQMSTIQVDFQTPQRFGIDYVGADNSRHRPVMIHRALFGSVERFFAVLVEHYAGAFPTWLSPVQVRVLPVARRPCALRARGAGAPGCGRSPRRGRGCRRASWRKGSPGQVGEGALRPRRRRRRCRRRNRRRQRPWFADARARRPPRCFRRASSGQKRPRPPRRRRVSGVRPSREPGSPVGGVAVELCELVRGCARGGGGGQGGWDRRRRPGRRRRAAAPRPAPARRAPARTQRAASSAGSWAPTSPTK